MNVKYKEVKTISEFIDSIRVRVDVFIKEIRFQPGWEPDDADKESRHFIAIANGKVVSTGRFREANPKEIKIERMATLKEYRGKGIGKGLLKFMMKEIKKEKPKRIFLMSHVPAKKFYEESGFKVISKPFEKYGFKHVEMEYQTKK